MSDTVDKDQEKKEKDRKLLEHIQSTFLQLQRVRLYKEPIWKDITDYVYPRRSDWFYGQDSDMRFGEKIFDGTAISALSRLADGLFGWMCAPTIDWLRFMPKDRNLEEDKKLMTYLRDVEMYLYSLFRASNFYDAMAEDITDGCALGTAVMYVEDDEKNKRPVFVPLHLKECFISENRFGEVDTLYRDFEMTKRQAVETFGERNLPQNFFADPTKPDMETKVRILHAIYPTGMDGFMKDSMPFRSVYVYQGESRSMTGNQYPVSVMEKQAIIKTGGLKFKRFLGWRFRKVAGEVYGSCSPMDALFDIKMQNLQAKTMADVAQLAARPPFQAPESMRGKIKIAPAGITYHTGEKAEPMVTTISYPLGIDAMNRRAENIREIFKTDYFMSISALQNSSRERTREEILQMKAESAAVTGSIVGRIVSERLNPIVRLVMAIEAEAERLPKPPKGVDPATKIDFEIVGPLAVTQRRFIRLQGFNQGLASLGGMMQIFGPDVAMNVDGNWATREMLKANGVPMDALKDVRQVAKEQDAAARARAEQAQAAMQLERDKIMAKSDKTPQAGSPLAKVMGEE